jgi:hypothetical protein
MEKKQDVKENVEDEKEDFENEYFDPKTLKFNYDLSKCKFELDIIQNKLLEFYLRSDLKFRRAFSTNFTNEFFQFIKDKARLREPITLSIMGNTRTFTNNNLIFTDLGWRNPNNMQDCKKVLSWNFDLEKYEWKKFELIIRERNPKEKYYKIKVGKNLLF